MVLERAIAEAAPPDRAGVIVYDRDHASSAKRVEAARACEHEYRLQGNDRARGMQQLDPPNVKHLPVEERSAGPLEAA
jgi:hypothetical protein